MSDPSKEEIKAIDLPHHNPSDLVHGILCEHVKHESGNAPFSEPNFKVGSPITFDDKVKEGSCLFGLFKWKGKEDYD